MRPTKEFKPFPGHPVKSLSYSPSGELFLCCCGNNQAAVYARDGKKIQITVRGDMYI